MREVPLFRLILVIMLIGMFFFTGCLGKSQSPRFYVLSSMPEDQAAARDQAPARDAIIGIGPIKLADYLDQSKLVTRTGDNKLVKAEFDLWAGSFKDNVTNVLAENIGFLVPTERIYIHPWRRSVPVEFQIVLDVVRCDGQMGEDALLVARWTLLSGQDKKLLAASRSSIREPVEGSGYASVVAAQSRALTKLSNEIVMAINSAKQE
jgi:uncharacterized lipoprotein YmbA